MIVFISKNDFLENKKKLLKMNVAILNSTDNEKISSLRCCRDSDDFSALQPNKALLAKGTGELSNREYDKKLRAWTEVKAFKKVVATAAATQMVKDDELNPNARINKNVLIILGTKCYSKFRKHLISEFKRILKLEDDDGPVVVDFRKISSLPIASETEKALEKEIKKLDKKIDKLSDVLSYADYDMVDGGDLDRIEKKIKKLRKERSKLAETMRGDSSVVQNTIALDTLKKNGAIKKSARKKLFAFVSKYHSKSAEDYTDYYS